MNPKWVACAQASPGLPAGYFPKTRFTRLSVSGHVDEAGKRVPGQESCFAVWFVLYYVQIQNAVFPTNLTRSPNDCKQMDVACFSAASTTSA
jgi:hypothetical protein